MNFRHLTYPYGSRRNTMAIPKALRRGVVRIARKKQEQGDCSDLTKAPEYKKLMLPHVERYRKDLEEMGYDPDTEWELCEWLVYHMMKD